MTRQPPDNQGPVAVRTVSVSTRLLGRVFPGGRRDGNPRRVSSVRRAASTSRPICTTSQSGANRVLGTQTVLTLSVAYGDNSSTTVPNILKLVQLYAVLGAEAHAESLRSSHRSSRNRRGADRAPGSAGRTAPVARGDAPTARGCASRVLLSLYSCSR